MSDVFFNREAASIAAAQAEYDARKAELSGAPVPEPKPEPKSFGPKELDSTQSPTNSSGIPDLSQSEQGQLIAAIEASDREIENQYRALGDHAKADEMKATREQRFAKQRADAGYVAPQEPSAEAKAGKDFGIHLDAQPTDYRGMNVNGFSSDAAAEDYRVHAGTLMAGMKLPKEVGTFLAEHIATTARELKAMTPEQVADWQRKEEAIVSRMTARSGATVEQVKSAVKEMLSWHKELGAKIADNALLSSSTLLVELANHYSAMKAFRSQGR